MSYKINTLVQSDKDVAQYEKRLSICLTPNGFSFSVSDILDQLLVIGQAECNLQAPIAELMADIKGVLGEAQIYPYGLKETELITISNQFVWIPQHLYDDSMQRTYLETLCKIQPTYSIHTDYNKDIKANIVFSADNNIVSAFKIVLPGIKIRCQHSKMVNSIVLENSDQKSLILIEMRGKESDFTVVCNKKLLLSNTYDCANIDETIFYALSLTKQLHLEDSRMMVALCGDVDRDVFSTFRHYFDSVVLYTGRPLTLTVPEMQHIHTYQYALVIS